MEQCVLAANAKINLSLDVVGRRPDGYHLLEMVMQSVSLHDQVTLRKNKDGILRITCSEPGIPCDERNIAYKSARLFFDHCGLPYGVDIHLQKRIPSQAGLGGGSADGAAVFVGLNQLFAQSLSVEELCQLGVQVGADIPFCIQGGTQLCKGIGEELSPLAPLPDCAIVLCKPDINVSTGEAYGRIDSGNILQRPDTNALCSALEHNDLKGVAQRLCNVFSSAIPLEPVAEIEQRMKEFGALGACMSGSGSAVYGLFSHSIGAVRCASALKERFSSVAIGAPARVGVSVLRCK